ncbi:hypothetical protein [Thermodesulfobacterium hydrogeniphilum]|uniref:hypothetical protein n=1 Tax=Thermodesulfobacterium hydrogeniphilum TaxID=161156 RepID=UPI00056E81B7|nr:hypothetical protein [Thermodesulfobacterium hydrogeniphilum]
MVNNLLLKFLTYLLAYHPEEFGLIPDNNGFFKIKEIFQVLIFTKKFKKVNLQTLKQVFSYYYRDFFEFLENFNLVKAKNTFYSPPVKINLSQIYNFNNFWSFVKPKIWLKISIDGIWKPYNQKIPLFADKELAENWAKVKGALVIQINPKFISEDTEVLQFGDNIFLVEKLPYSALKGPPIDNKFLKKYGPKEKTPEKPEPITFFKEPLIFETKNDLEDIPFRKITYGKKKERPWKKYQKKKAKEKGKF